MVSYRSLDLLTYETVQPDLDSIQWDTIYTYSHIDPMISTLISNLQHILDNHAPLKTRTLRRPTAPWLTSEIKAMMKRREAARRKFRRTRLAEDYTAFKVLRNSTQLAVRRAKSLYFHDALTNAPDSKSKWKILQKLSQKESNTCSSFPVTPDDLNKYFLSFSSNITPIADIEHRPFNPESFFFSHISYDDLLTCILKSHTNDYGPDNIPVKLIKSCLPVLIPILYHIYNFSLQNSVFPLTWKTALVRPLKKIANPSAKQDFRPISLLSNLSKPLERLVQYQISNFLEEHSLINPLQSGFRPGYSTQSALLKITHDLQTSIESKQLTILILLDFSKAFDSVNHNILPN